MDISDIDSFHTYEPLFDENPQHIVDDICKFAEYLTKDEKKMVKKAYTVARDAHVWVTRLSGEPYIIHPVRVLEFLMMLQPDAASMQAALLHDVIEDTPMTYEDIKKIFGDEVAELCEWLVKVSKVRFTWEERQLETLKKTFLAMWKDLRVIFIKLADRIHNIQTLHYHPKKHKRFRIAQETLKVFVPVAKRLWLYVYQWFLENWAFKNRDPKEYQRIYDYVVKKYWDVDRYKNSWIDRLKYLSEEDEIPYLDVKWRLKSPYRIHKKLQKYQTKDISKVMDILAFRILTDSVWDCYNMLGLIHKHYTPIFAKMKDYIALPKPNWYRSLHTTILWMYDFPVEIQVRTKDMEQVAEYWVAAHFAYAEEWISTRISDKQAEWIHRLQDIVNKFQEAEDKEGFKQHLNVEILEKNIFVYTPKWDIIELPQNSTVLDFAFRIHSDIWFKFKNAFINWRIVPVDYVIKTGDIVDIKTFKNKVTATASRDRYLNTPSAKSKLSRFLRHNERESKINGIRKMLDDRLQSFWLPLLWSKNDRILKNFTKDEWEHEIMRIADKQITPTKLIKTFYQEQMKKIEDERKASWQKKKKQITIKKKPQQVVIVDNDKELEVVLCPECLPKISKKKKIIAKSDSGFMKIHCVSCTALDTIKSNRLYEAHRNWKEPTTYVLKLTLLLVDRPWVLLRLLKVLEFFQLNFNNLTTEPRDEKWTEVYLEIDITSLNNIDYLLNEIKSQEQFMKVVSKEIW